MVSLHPVSLLMLGFLKDLPGAQLSSFLLLTIYLIISTVTCQPVIYADASCWDKSDILSDKDGITANLKNDLQSIIVESGGK